MTELTQLGTVTKLPEPQKLAAAELDTEVTALAQYGAGYEVATAEQFVDAGRDLQRIKGVAKRLTELRTGITKPMDAAKKAVMDLFRGPEAKLEQAEASIKAAMVVYTREQERLRQEQQRKADEAARKERERLDAQAREAQRKAEEKAAALRKAAEEAAAAGATEEAARLAEKAASTEAKGAEKAAGLEERAATVVAPVISRAPPKVAGVSFRKVPKFEITDASQLPREYLAPDLKKIGGVVDSMGIEANIAGVRVWLEDQVAAGST